jgi:hypothetical protein
MCRVDLLTFFFLLSVVHGCIGAKDCCCIPFQCAHNNYKGAGVVHGLFLRCQSRAIPRIPHNGILVASRRINTCLGCCTFPKRLAIQVTIFSGERRPIFGSSTDIST